MGEKNGKHPSGLSFKCCERQWVPRVQNLLTIHREHLEQFGKTQECFQLLLPFKDFEADETKEI